jgi:hypothetical protein
VTTRLCLYQHASVSDAAGAANEDAFGHQGRCLWVLDGATGVAPRSCTPGPTDAAWLAHRASQRLGGLARQPMDLAGMLINLQEQLAGDFESVCTDPQACDRDLPTSCLGLVQLDTAAAQLHVACIGDITVLLTAPDGRVQHLTDTAVQTFGDHTLDAWRAARRDSRDPAHWYQAARQVILANRERVNRPAGYWVLHPRRSWLAGVRHFSVPALAGMRVLVASDGFYRLVDLYAEFSDAQLVQQAFAQGLAPMVEHLRAVERSDPEGDRFARIKATDDATCLLAEVVAEPSTTTITTTRTPP